MKAGFNQKSNISDWIRYDMDRSLFFVSSSNGKYFLHQKGLSHMEMDFFCIKKVKYVHQLQNLYFALTDIELSFHD